MDLISLILRTAYIMGVSLLLQAAQQTWPEWAKSVEDRMGQGRTALSNMEDRVTKNEFSLHDTQRAIQSQQATVAKALKLLEEVPVTLGALSTNIDEISTKQVHLQEAVDRIKVEPSSKWPGIIVGILAGMFISIAAWFIVKWFNVINGEKTDEQNTDIQVGGVDSVVPSN